MKREGDAKKLLVIYNPKAAHGRAAGLQAEIEACFESAGMPVEMHVTRRKRHGQEIVAAADFSKYRGIVSAGGDGTLFEVVNGSFLTQSPARIPIGVLPVGTGNSFTRELGLESGQWRAAIDMIGRGRTARVDVARCRCERQVFHFLNVLGLGFVTDVQQISDRIKALGNLAYVLGVLVQILFLKSYAIRLELDGCQLERRISLLEVANTRYTARTFLIAPMARFDDGFLDVILSKSMSRARLFSIFRKVFSGGHTNEREVETFKVKRLRIDSASPLKLGPDGEIVGATPAEIECLPGAIEVFAP